MRRRQYKLIYYKTDEEIEQMRASADLVSKAHGLVAQMIKAGTTGKIIDKAVEEFICDHDAIPGFKGYGGFPATLCISVNEGVVHGIPDDEPFKEGDIVSVDCGVILNDFYGDCAFTYPIGEVKEDVHQLMKVTNECLYRAIDAAKVGARIGDIGYAVQSYAEKEYKYGIVRELVGHGVGKELHEDPQVPNYGRRGKGTQLKDGLVIAIEPMVNLGTRRVKTLKDGWTVISADKKPSAHYEHTVVVRKSGTEILTTHKYIFEAFENNEEVIDLDFPRKS